MQALKKWLSARWRWRKLEKPVNPAENLPDSVKQELQALTHVLKQQRVSVRELYRGETTSDTPEIDAEPFK